MIGAEQGSMFWVYVLGSTRHPKVMHETYFDAAQEAERLAVQEGKTTFVVAPITRFEVEKPPVRRTLLR